MACTRSAPWERRGVEFFFQIPNFLTRKYVSDDLKTLRQNALPHHEGSAFIISTIHGGNNEFQGIDKLFRLCPFRFCKGGDLDNIGLIMRTIPARLAVCLSIAFGLGLSCPVAFGCSCVAPPPGYKSARELAEWRTQGLSAIFEGTVEASEMKSPLLEASAGDIVPANLEQSTPVMLVSFSVSRSYRGVRQQHVQIETGLRRRLRLSIRNG
jgi:hypothetical protein